MLEMKRILKIGMFFILFVLLIFIVSLLLFSVLDKYYLLDNKIVRFMSTVFSVIIGISFMQFLIKKIQ